MSRSRIVVAAVLGLLLWFFAGTLIGGRSFVFRDAAHFYHPLFEWTAGEWSAGRLPLWNPYENCGMPVLAETTSSVLYPGKLIFALPVDFTTRYVLYVTVHVALAAVAAYCLGRAWRCSPLASGVCAVSYAFGGNVLIQYSNVVFLVSAAWLPVALLAIDRMLVRRSVRWAALFGAVLALMTLGGDPQASYHCGLLAVLYAGLLWWKRRRRKSASKREMATSARRRHAHRLFRNRFALLSMAAAAGAILAAVQIIPAVQWSRVSDRAAYARPRNIYEAATFAVRNDRSARNATTWQTIQQGLVGNPPRFTHHADAYDFSVEPWRAAELIWPNFSGRMFPVHRRWTSVIPASGRQWTPSLYMGLLPLLLGLGAWRVRRGTPRVRWLSWTAVLFAVASLGWYGVGWVIQEVRHGVWGVDPDDTPLGFPVGGLYWWMVVVMPGYVYFRYPAKLLVVSALAMSLLAARGWDRMAEGRATGLLRTLLTLAALSLGLGTAFFAIGPSFRAWLTAAPRDDLFGPLDIQGAWMDVLSALLHASIVCLASGAVLVWMRKRGQAWWRPVLLALIAVDLAIAHGWLIATAPKDAWSEPSAMAQRIEEHVNQSHGPRGYRVHRGSPVRWTPPDWLKTSAPDRQVVGLEWDRATLLPRYQSPAGVRLAESAGTITSLDYQIFLNVARQYGPLRADDYPEPHRNVLNAISARYVILPQGSDLDRLQPIKQDDATAVADAELWYNPDALPRTWIVHEVHQLEPLQVRNPADIELLTREVLFPNDQPRGLRTVAVVETNQALNLTAAADPSAQTAETCRIVVDEPQRVEIEAELVQPGLVVLNDYDDGNWQAHVSSNEEGWRKVDLLRTNRVMRGVLLPAGRHRIVYTYRPFGFYCGALISLAGWIALVVICSMWIRSGGQPG